MRSIKALIAAAITAAIAMALIGTAPAMAENTALCKVLEDPCKTKAMLEKEKIKSPTENQIHVLHMTLSAGEQWVWGPETFSVICQQVLLKAEVEGLENPLTVKVKTLTYSECTLNGEPCEVKEEEAGVTYILDKTAGKNVGLLKIKGILQVHCMLEEGGNFDCVNELDGNALPFIGRVETKEHGMLTEDGTKLKTFGAPCSENGEEITEGLLEPLEDVYITT